MTEYTPNIAPSHRTVVYVGSLGVNVLAGLALVVVVALELLPLTTALILFGGLSWALSTINSALGTAYRPTRPELQPSTPEGTGRHRADG